MAGVEMRITDDDGTVLPRDGKTVGEFEIRGPWITGSYFGVDDPEKFRDGWLRTGDIGTLDAEGFMVISDRTKDVIKSGGEWISSVELEGTMMAHPAVFEAAVIAVPDEQWQERPLCCVVLRPGATCERRGTTRLPRRAGRQVVAAGALGLHRARAQDQRGQVRQEGAARSVRRGRARRHRTRLVESFDDSRRRGRALSSVACRTPSSTRCAPSCARDASEAKELERRLSKVRRSLQKAEIPLARRRARTRRQALTSSMTTTQVHVVASVEVEARRLVVLESIIRARGEASGTSCGESASCSGLGAR